MKLFPNVSSPLKDVSYLDFYLVRENTEDFYCSMGARFNATKNKSKDAHLRMDRKLYSACIDLRTTFTAEGSYAINIGLISEVGCERVMRYSFDLARKKGKKKLTSVDKANVLPDVYGVWRETFERVAKEYPGIQTESSYVDAMTMWMIKKPNTYGIVVAPNLFGDILTDLGAAISGGLGFAAGANINPEGTSMFEPIHGSAPKYKGMDVANPIATILSGSLLLSEIGEEELASLVDNAVEEVLREGAVRTMDMGGKTGTKEAGEIIARKVKDLGREKVARSR